MFLLIVFFFTSRLGSYGTYFDEDLYTMFSFRDTVICRVLDTTCLIKWNPSYITWTYDAKIKKIKRKKEKIKRHYVPKY